MKTDSYRVTSSCLIQFRGWKIPILTGDWRGHSGLSRSLNRFVIYRCSYNSSWTLQDSADSPSQLTFFHHISAWWSEAHLVSHLSFWGSSSCSRILYSDVNNFISLFINLSGRKAKLFYVLLISNKETLPFSTSLLQTLIILVDLNGYVNYWLFMHEWTVIEENMRFHIH